MACVTSLQRKWYLFRESFKFAVDTTFFLLSVSLACRLFWVIIFRAPYLPWVILFLDFLSGAFRWMPALLLLLACRNRHVGLGLLVTGRSFVENLIGIGLGHVYYFLADVWPRIAEARHFRAKRLIRAPRILCVALGPRLHPYVAQCCTVLLVET